MGPTIRTFVEPKMDEATTNWKKLDKKREKIKRTGSDTLGKVTRVYHH